MYIITAEITDVTGSLTTTVHNHSITLREEPEEEQLVQLFLKTMLLWLEGNVSASPFLNVHQVSHLTATMLVPVQHLTLAIDTFKCHPAMKLILL